MKHNYLRGQVGHEQTPIGITALLEPSHIGRVVHPLQGQVVLAHERGQVVEGFQAHLVRGPDVAVLPRAAGVNDRDRSARRAVGELVRRIRGVVAPREMAHVQRLGGRLDDGKGGGNGQGPAHDDVGEEDCNGLHPVVFVSSADESVGV